jgi:hypothetical protein
MGSPDPPAAVVRCLTFHIGEVACHAKIVSERLINFWDNPGTEDALQFGGPSSI